MRILLSAYACEPDKGSEPEVGMQTLLAAAARHDVWVLTRTNNIAALVRYLRDDPRRERITLVGLDLQDQLQKWKRRHPMGLQLYYELWQRAAATKALELHSKVAFDLVHHVTFAAYWKRAGVAKVPCPLVWGPVGGGLAAPPNLWPYLGPFGIMEELMRIAIRPLIARLPSVRSLARRADVLLVQNHETSRRLRTTARSVVAPNALSVHLPPVERTRDGSRTIAIVGNLIPLKAVSLALRAVSYMSSTDVEVVVIGDGPDRARLSRVARRRGLSERVRFTGAMPRAEVLRQVASANLLLHPAVHEEAGMAVAEALTLGTPVVCLDQGGPPELLRYWPSTHSRAVAPSTYRGTAKELARAVEDLLARPSARACPPCLPIHSYDSIVNWAYDAAVRGDTEASR